MSYIIRSGSNPKMILTKNCGFKPEQMVGPGGYPAKTYKSKKVAERCARILLGTPEELGTAFGPC